MDENRRDALSAFSSDAPGQLDVLRHDSDALGVNGAQVRVFEQAHQVSLTGFLETELKK